MAMDVVAVEAIAMVMIVVTRSRVRFKIVLENWTRIEDWLVRRLEIWRSRARSGLSS